MKKLVLVLLGIVLGATAVLGYGACKEEIEEVMIKAEMDTYITEQIKEKYDDEVNVDYYTYEGENIFGYDVWKVSVHNDSDNWTTKIYMAAETE